MVEGPKGSETFQSTPPRGGRRDRQGPGLHGATVSIHAPAWGATRPWSKARRAPRRFNPRPRVGGDGPGPGTRDAVHGVSIHAPAWGATVPLKKPYISEGYMHVFADPAPCLSLTSNPFAASRSFSLVVKEQIHSRTSRLFHGRLRFAKGH